MKYLLGFDIEDKFNFHPAVSVFSKTGKIYNEHLKINISPTIGLCYDEYFMHINWMYETKFKWLLGGNGRFEKLVECDSDLALLFCQHFPIHENSEISVSEVGFKVWRKDRLQKHDYENLLINIYE